MKISILESAMVIEGGDAFQGISDTIEVAKHADKLGYERIWLAEHHNIKYIASSAPQILIGTIAEKTKNIKVGSGGIMLPNHTPLIIAEQFGTLDTIYPNRIDLGLGRASGTNQLVAAQLRKNNIHRVNTFESDIIELQNYFDNSQQTEQKVTAFPGQGRKIPIWILGSSIDSAYLASKLGLPYSFASHFAPAQFEAALKIYRDNFIPSERLSEPYIIAGLNIFAAESNQEAAHFMTTLYKMYVNFLTNNIGPLEPPGELPPIYSGHLKSAIDDTLRFTFHGNKNKLKKDIGVFASKYKVNEIMIVSPFYDLQAKLASLSIIKNALL
ncbi:LLM class flavin-dependent oxidoreductase [Chryseobacterium sp. Chry.R1]|uniref:LLM class flavin-dependent oxidoreductase n=1 Tax=Chryseobacterium sp. Chry.R1 TaxID=3139392 RepID=UPI0031FA0CCD